MAKRKSPLSTVIETVVTIAIAVGVAILIQAFVVKPYRIPSSSMEPTLNINQRVLVSVRRPVRTEHRQHAGLERKVHARF